MNEIFGERIRFAGIYLADGMHICATWADTYVAVAAAVVFAGCVLKHFLTAW